MLNQIRIDPWQLYYVSEDGYVGLNVPVPSMQAQVSFQADCTKGTIKLDPVTWLNSDALEAVKNGCVSRYGIPTGTHVDGQTYMTMAEVVVSKIVTAAELKYGIYWAQCDPPKNQMGEPRFAFQARTVVQFSALTNYYSQTWSKNTGFGPLSGKPAYTSSAVDLRLTSPWSRLDQIGAHFNCNACIAMPVGAGRDWVWYPPIQFQIYPPPPATPNGPTAPKPVG